MDDTTVTNDTIIFHSMFQLILLSMSVGEFDIRFTLIERMLLPFCSFSFSFFSSRYMLVCLFGYNVSIWMNELNVAYDENVHEYWKDIRTLPHPMRGRERKFVWMEDVNGLMWHTRTNRQGSICHLQMCSRHGRPPPSPSPPPFSSRHICLHKSALYPNVFHWIGRQGGKRVHTHTHT